MLDYSVNEICAGENDDLIKRGKANSMNILKNNTLNCPTVLAGMSHEMRTQMNAIVAFSYLMKEKSCSNSEREEFNRHILSSCEQLIELFDSFLNSAIIDTGKSKTDSGIYRLDNFLDDLISEFREIIRKEGYINLELITEINFSDLTEVIIDKNRIFRIIRSLFQNSLKNTKSGYIKIGYYFRDDNITFYVIDSGQGYFKCKEFLHTEDLNESLVLINDTSTAINMTLARKIIQMLDGSIWIECNGLTGTGMYFSIPVRSIANSNININKFLNTMIAI